MVVTTSPTALQLGFVLLYFVYGLSFFTMGIALLLESGRSPALAERRVIRPLAVFGLFHGVHEWMEIILLQGLWLGMPVPVDFQMLRLVLLALSFIPLVIFGVLVLFPQAAILRLSSLGALLLAAYLGLIFVFLRSDATSFIARSDALARYLLAIPGGVMAALALRARSRQVNLERRTTLGRNFRWAAMWFGIYGLTQVMVPPSDMFPANYLNSAWFQETTGIPIQIIRAAAAVMITLSLLRAIQFVENERERQLLDAQRSRFEALEQIQRELELRAAMRKELLSHTVIAQEEERSRIAREIHDETSQILTGFSLELATLRSLLSKRSPAAQYIERLQSYCRQMSHGLYRLVSDLRPAQLDDLGLVAALQHLADDLRNRVGLEVSLDIDGARQRMDPLVETVIYRVAQEALSNASRHAQVNTASLHLAFEPQAVTLRVCDQGIGFDPTLDLIPPRGWGLAGMRERVESVGGDMQIESSPGKGTNVVVTIPVTYTPPASPKEEVYGQTHTSDVGG